MVIGGKLFVFEGTDGSGKTTLSHAFADHLNAIGIECEWLSFPGNEEGTLGKRVYEIHHDQLHGGIRTIDPTSLQLLHVAAHIDAINRRILPALKQGRVVILDRYWWSTYVYGLVAGVSRRPLRCAIELELIHWKGVRPACVYLIRRKQPLAQSASLEDLALTREYDKLGAQEAAEYLVSIIDNDGTVASVLKDIIRIARIEEGPSNLHKRHVAAQKREPVKRDAHIVAKLPHVFSKLTPAKTTVVYDTYWRFATERQAIFFRRFIGEPPHWTADSILREYKFTNAYRASDRTSQYLIRNVIYTGDQSHEEVFFRTMLFKLFNRIQTWELLSRALSEISYRDYSFGRYDAILTDALNDGATIYSAAYIMPSGSRSSTEGRKHRMHLRLVEQMLKEDVPSRLAESPSMGKAFEVLRSYPTLGDFLAYQYVTDLNYGTLLDFSEMEFVVPGPGARDGIRKCFSDFGGLSEVDIIKLVSDRQQAEFERLGLEFQSLWGRPLQLIDCQNLFCEVDKYSRVRHPEVAGRTGRTRIKQKYRITPGSIHYWYPPKWGLNERITKGGELVSSI